MNPQPPVTRMRMAARTSSADKSAPAESSPAFAGVRRYLAHWQDALAGKDWVPWAILGLAVFLRFLLLGMKPPHFDEGINGWFVDQVVKNGFYRYDPTNYHGPLHFYVLLLGQAAGRPGPTAKIEVPNDDRGSATGFLPRFPHAPPSWGW